MTDDQLTQIRERLQQVSDLSLGCQHCDEFNAHAADDIASLLALVDQLRQEAKKVAGCAGNCSCEIGDRHFWHTAFCEERDACARLRTALEAIANCSASDLCCQCVREMEAALSLPSEGSRQ